MKSMTGETLACEWLCYDVVNYAMQQNYVPVVRKVILSNLTSEDMHQITVRISAEPEFMKEWSKTLDYLPANQSVVWGPLDLQLSGTFLAGMTERLAGSLTLQVFRGEERIAVLEAPLAVLAYDQWGGLSSMPEMAAAFIMPNHPAIAKVIGDAAAFLGEWTGNPSFDAYQSRNPNRVRQQAAAVYSAVQALQPTYCVAPASFEELGQRVRLPDAILGNRMGNCLDLTLLYAACLEAVGLHPLVILTKGHAFPGVWLVEDSFPEMVQDDISLLTKRLAAGVHELDILEATLMCSGSRAPYEEAEAAALSRLNNPEEFIGFIDVHRARAGSIRPLPVRVPTASGWEVLQEDREPPVKAPAPQEIAVHRRPEEVDSISVPKQKQWERKLLDLTLRNSLLNFRLTKSALPLLNSNLGELEDALADGREYQILARPSDWENTVRSADLFQSVSHSHPLAGLIHQEFQHQRLRADAGDRELAEKAIHLYRSARLSLEENGANTLYLALGLLKWYESGSSVMPRYAPVVLVPVELVRRTSRSGFLLRARDEEAQINITLLEMLRQDFGCQIGGLDPLPRDEKGIDLSGVFTAIRHVVMNMPRWDIVESAMLGLFSFSRFVMWNDIRSRSEELARNKVVASLMAGRMEWTPGNPFPAAEDLDEHYAPDRLLLPISADSSQITAVCAAHGENSFVLHGPPGTGKSQTITNLIASALAGGKTVLFVAEKMAALSVVQSRLEQIGLGPFCLELHSNKSTKKAVLEQLRLTLETARTASPEDWTRQAERLSAARTDLNGYVASLHRRHGFGASLYEAVTRYGEVKSAPAAVVLDPETVGRMDKDGYLAWTDLARELQVAGEAAGHPHDHAWTGATCSEYTPIMRSQAEELLAAYAKRASEFRAAYEGLTRWLGYSVPHPELGDVKLLAEVAELLAAVPEGMPAVFLGASDVEAACSTVAQAARHGRLRNEVRSLILARFNQEALAFDAEGALAEWRRAELQWFLPKLLKQNRICKLLRSMGASNTASPSKLDTPVMLSHLVRYRSEAASLQLLEPAASAVLGPVWNQGEADWEAVSAAGEWILKLHQALLRLFKDAAAAKQARERLADLLAAGAGAFREQHGKSAAAYLASQKELLLLADRLAELLSADWTALDAARGERPWLEGRAAVVERWTRNIGSLREWCSWRQVRRRAVDAGLSSLVEAYEQGALQHADVMPSFSRAWWKAAVEHILKSEPSLASFSGRLFEEKIKSFQETVERYEALTRQEIAARLAARVPPLQNQAASHSEAGILLRAIRSGGRGLSLRKLFEQIPNLLNRLCPCLLMSPISVAQYIDPKYAPFDLVVFDEASQLPTSEAVGAMARGRNVVVVGDPKQLPPTSFFTGTGGEESDDSTVPEDLESILDDCLALGMPQEHLLWHYRSRHESLIAFSNRHFYENKLLTFPSPYERRSNVRWHPVEGYYDRGKTKMNRAEAEQVVEEIARRLRDPELRKLSIGVVTFNSIQMTLVEDLLDEAFRKSPELEQAAAQMAEPIFVKNLENVQGDERDVILFSIGYGPDATGKVVLNFGPLNREGGWRRLNVAVSRARHEMHVFSTLRAEHLDVSRTRAQGVGVLRSFLEYAEKGVPALGYDMTRLADRSTGIEVQLAEALRQEGYKVDLQVGASEYGMDLAVVDPAEPETYLLAVLCDGTGYRAGKTARDREVLRGQVLRQLGWRIHRVWSMDWLDDPRKEIQRILEVLRRLQAEPRQAAAAAAGEAKTVVDPRAEPGVRAPGEPGMRASGEPGVRALEESEVEPAAVPETDGIAVPGKEKPAAAVEPPAQPVPAAAAPVASVSPRSRRSAYTRVELPAMELPSEEFYSPAHAGAVRSQIRQVIAGEGPISRPLLVKRVLQAWGITRSGARIERYIGGLMDGMDLTRTQWGDLTVFWPDPSAPEQYGAFRVADTEQDRRNAEDLPPEEVANAIGEVLFHQGSLPVEDLVRETVKLLGYSRSGAALDKAVRTGLESAVGRGMAAVENGRVIYR